MSRARDRANTAPSLFGRTILIVQRQWVIATHLASAFEAAGARVLSVKDARVGLTVTDHPGLAAAVLDGKSEDLYPILRARNVPFVIYSGSEPAGEERADVLVVRKPAKAEEVVRAVEGLLARSVTPYQTSRG